MKFVPVALTRAFGNSALTFKQNRPHIAFGLGVAGVLVGNVLACRATLKLHETLDDIQAEIEDVKTHREEGTEERYKDLGYVYGKSAVRMARLYGPAVVVTGVSIASLTGAHVEMHRRNQALAATVYGLSKAFEEYRSRVRQEIGEEREYAVYYGAQEVTTVDEDGKKTTQLETLGDPNKVSPFAILFDEYSRYWQKNAEMNRMFVQVQQNHFNQALQTRGHVFLNEVYDALGVDRTQAGAMMGWTLENGDGYVDFGMFATDKTGFINGWERSVLLDFNVDPGPIIDHI